VEARTPRRKPGVRTEKDAVKMACTGESYDAKARGKQAQSKGEGEGVEQKVPANNLEENIKGCNHKKQSWCTWCSGEKTKKKRKSKTEERTLIEKIGGAAWGTKHRNTLHRTESKGNRLVTWRKCGLRG